MNNKYLRISFLILIVFILIILSYHKIFKKDKKIVSETTLVEKENTVNSNIIKDVKYTSRDVKGNEYVITASEGEIDFSDSNIIFLTDVYATVILKNSNVIINYLHNKITGEYLDFSPKRNSMIVSKNIVYTNLKNILKADVIEIDLKTKDTKIYMYENEKKVKIQSRN